MLKKLFVRLSKANIVPLVILTKADLTTQSGGQTDYQDAAHIYDSGVVDTARQFFAKSVDLPVGYVMPMVNYLVRESGRQAVGRNTDRNVAG